MAESMSQFTMTIDGQPASSPQTVFRTRAQVIKKGAEQAAGA